MRSLSLKRRMTIVSTLVLVLAFSIIFLITRAAYTNASKSRLQESLVSQIYALMAVAEEQDSQLYLPEMMRNDRLNHLNSGLVGYVLDVDGDLLWRSRSSDAYSILPDISASYSLNKLTESKLDNDAMFWIGDTIIWEHENKMEGEYLFLIGEEQKLLNASVSQFTKEIMLWLSISAVVLIFVLGFALNISLLPLKQAQRQIELVSRGDADTVEGDFPAELLPLTTSINSLLESEAKQKSRYRDSLGNLAHSLKTPLAVMKSEIHYVSDITHQSQMQKQIERIDDIVRYQLNRSVVTAGQALTRKSPVAPDVKKIVEALRKVHHEKQINIQYLIDDDCYFPGEQGDLMELIGNLADNACKWAQSKVHLSAMSERGHLIVSVEDDGTGIPQEKRKLILDRGKRLDEQAEGQGLGLSIVMDIIKTYRGEINILPSELGGAKFVVQIPL